MIDTRLTGLLSHAKKYIVYNIFWQWISLLAQIGAVFSIADFWGRQQFFWKVKKKKCFWHRDRIQGLYMGQDTYCADNLCGSSVYSQKTGTAGHPVRQAWM